MLSVVNATGTTGVNTESPLPLPDQENKRVKIRKHNIMVVFYRNMCVWGGGCN